MGVVVSYLVDLLVTALIAGLLGMAAMEVTMGLIARAGWAKGSMIIALGSLVTKSREGAVRTGVLIHGISAVIFSMGYTLVIRALGFSGMPASLMLGLGIGFVHGMIVSLMLVWVVNDHHPLAEFRDADLAIGLAHLAGHVAFGAMVGLVVGISPL